MNYMTALIQLPLLRETPGVILRTPSDVATACADIASLAQETFHILTLTAKNHLINRHLISIGIVDASLIHAREVFRAALSDVIVAAILLSHNHPSGDSTPSAEDIRITKQLIDAGRIMGIKVLDHVIIGRKSDTHQGFTSLRESGLCDFDKAA